MRTIVWDNRVDITLAGGLFGISITKGRDENDKDLLHLHVKQSITEEYIGDITKNETGKPAKFIPKKINNIVKKYCENCGWLGSDILVKTKYPIGTCLHPSNQSAVLKSIVMVELRNWCRNWKEKAK